MPNVLNDLSETFWETVMQAQKIRMAELLTERRNPIKQFSHLKTYKEGVSEA
jgi:hypothetical protein